MSEGVFDAYNVDAVGDVTDSNYEAGVSEGEQEEIWSGSEEDWRSDDARRRRERQNRIIAARRARQGTTVGATRAATAVRPVAPARPTAPLRPVAGSSAGQAQALAAIRDLDADTAAALQSLRRDLEKVKRKGEWAAYSAAASTLAVQATDTFEDNLNGHPIVRALARLAPIGFLYDQGAGRGVAKFFASPFFVTGAGVSAILLSSKLLQDAQGETAITVAGPSTIVMGTPAQLTAVATDRKGNVVDVGTFTWKSSSDPVATVDGSGKVTPGTPGTVLIFASAGGFTGRQLVIITAAPDIVPMDKPAVK